MDNNKDIVQPLIAAGVGLVMTVILGFIWGGGDASPIQMIIGSLIVAALSTLIGIPILFVVAALMKTGFGSLPLALLKFPCAVLFATGIYMLAPIGLLGTALFGAGVWAAIIWLFDVDQHEAGITTIIFIVVQFLVSLVLGVMLSLA